MIAIKRRSLLLALAVLVAAGLAAWVMARDRHPVDPMLSARVEHGEFQVVVNTTGELRASKFVEIQAPPNAQQVNQYQMKISSLVPEGTVVHAGEVVAELDRSGIAAKSSEVSLALQKAEAQATQAMLDSTLALAQAREEIRTLTYAVEEKRIAKEQARYEAPSVRRQAEIDLEKAERALEQAKTNSVTKRRQAEAKMQEVSTDVERQRNMLKLVSEVMEGFTIKAPESGMVIYEKEWNGKKKVAGSQVTPWDPTVATLPDLARMESVTFVNEIDVRKIASGQSVMIALDSDPSKRLTGTVTAVANVGEQRPNTDAKVFEVKITIAESDTTLRPGMTTSNAIVTTTIGGSLSIPLEAVFNEEDVPYVYKRDGRRIVRQEIEGGVMNDNAIVVLRGVEKGDEVLLSAPQNRESIRTNRLPQPPPQDGTRPDSSRVETGTGARSIGEPPDSATSVPVSPAAPRVGG
jgi:multidrug efflux pump subunit AcrA (membrane-fusion protein)